MKKINTILIANRGEIASRIIRTCKSLGIKSIAIYSEADRKSKYVNEADISIYIGKSNPKDSYLNINAILKAANESNADAIHPGYGFLSENANFAQKCIEKGLIFIGPNPEIIKKMGFKSEAKKFMNSIGVPIIKGYSGKDQTNARLIKESKKIGFPLLLKASAGGGGKGMRVVNTKNELEHAIKEAKSEGLNAFGSDDLIIEKYIKSSRHIEFQILGDKYGNAIHILERECTIQRRYQKIIEETPSPIMTKTLRKKMGDEAIKIAKALNYDNAGTVEFLYDTNSKKFYFLEVNTRLQVEHPITEMLTNLDLVALQIQISQGLALNLKQKNINGKGYAVEVRLYSENVNENFMPETGSIYLFEPNDLEGFRIESSVSSGSKISVYYDPMIAKLITWGSSRETAHDKMIYVLEHLKCMGTITNQNFLKEIFQDNNFRKGKYNINFIENFIKKKKKRDPKKSSHKAIISGLIFNWWLRNKKRKILMHIPSGWRNNFYEYQKETVLIDKKKLTISYKYKNKKFFFKIDSDKYNVKINKIVDNKFWIEFNNIQELYTINKKDNKFFIHSVSSGNVSFNLSNRLPLILKKIEKGNYTAPMPAQIIKILVKKSEKVKAGDPLIIISSMKMENTICASKNGKVEKINIKEGDNIKSGTILLSIK